jgi:hypothetical protein
MDNYQYLSYLHLSFFYESPALAITSIRSTIKLPINGH